MFRRILLGLLVGMFLMTGVCRAEVDWKKAIKWDWKIAPTMTFLKDGAKWKAPLAGVFVQSISITEHFAIGTIALPTEEGIVGPNLKANTQPVIDWFAPKMPDWLVNGYHTLVPEKMRTMMKNADKSVLAGAIGGNPAVSIMIVGEW